MPFVCIVAPSMALIASFAFEIHSENPGHPLTGLQEGARIETDVRPAHLTVTSWGNCLRRQQSLSRLPKDSAALPGAIEAAEWAGPADSRVGAAPVQVRHMPITPGVCSIIHAQGVRFALRHMLDAVADQ